MDLNINKEKSSKIYYIETKSLLDS